MKRLIVILLLIVGSNFALASDSDPEKLVNEYIEKLEQKLLQFQNQMQSVKEEFKVFKGLHKNCSAKQTPPPVPQAPAIQPSVVPPMENQLNLSFQPFRYPDGRVLFLAPVHGTMVLDPITGQQWYQPFILAQ